MARAGFAMNGMSKIYADGAVTIDTGIPEAVGIEINIVPQNLKKEIHFYENDLVKGNYLFRKFILKPDIQNGIRLYEENR